MKSVSYSVGAALLSSVSAVLLFLSFHRFQSSSLAWACLIRFGVNGLMAFGLAWSAGELFISHKNPNTKIYLHLWGILGASTIVSYFFAIRGIGAGRASVWLISQALVYPVLESLLFKTKLNLRVLLSVVGSAAGIFFLKQGASQLTWEAGDLWGMISCLAAALAYLCMSRVPEKVPSHRFMGYWAFWSSLVLPLLFVGDSSAVPTQYSVWILLLVSAVMASLAQWLTSVAYQEGSSRLVNSLSFLTPVFSLFIDGILLKIPFHTSEITGASLLILFGALIPLGHRQAAQSRDAGIEIGMAGEKRHDAA